MDGRPDITTFFFFFLLWFDRRNRCEFLSLASGTGVKVFRTRIGLVLFRDSPPSHTKLQINVLVLIWNRGNGWWVAPSCSPVSVRWFLVVHQLYHRIPIMHLQRIIGMERAKPDLIADQWDVFWDLFDRIIGHLNPTVLDPAIRTSPSAGWYIEVIMFTPLWNKF